MAILGFGHPEFRLRLVNLLFIECTRLEAPSRSPLPSTKLFHHRAAEVFLCVSKIIKPWCQSLVYIEPRAEMHRGKVFLNVGATILSLQNLAILRYCWLWLRLHNEQQFNLFEALGGFSVCILVIRKIFDRSRGGSHCCHQNVDAIKLLYTLQQRHSKLHASYKTSEIFIMLSTTNKDPIFRMTCINNPFSWSHLPGPLLTSVFGLYLNIEEMAEGRNVYKQEYESKYGARDCSGGRHCRPPHQGDWWCSCICHWNDFQEINKTLTTMYD